MTCGAGVGRAGRLGTLLMAPSSQWTQQFLTTEPARPQALLPRWRLAGQSCGPHGPGRTQCCCRRRAAAAADRAQMGACGRSLRPVWTLPAAPGGGGRGAVTEALQLVSVGVQGWSASSAVLEPPCAEAKITDWAPGKGLPRVLLEGRRPKVRTSSPVLTTGERLRNALLQK